jgi:pimeloyl-ACP methyl ester carboxylesterase
MNRTRLALVLPASVAALAVACGSSAPSEAAYAPPPASVVVDDPGAVKIRREVFVLDGVTPPPNPVLAAATPPAQNKVRVMRWRVDADPPKAARAIVVMMPGFLGGAGSFDALARAIVRRSAEGDALEAWAIDRRSNLLEDTFGEDVAEVKRDPSLAKKYYFDGEPVLGKSFDGFVSSTAVPWASEWGVPTTLGDLRNVIALVPAADRVERVILLGHSLGASLVEEYAAWDFDGARGYGDVAGLVLLDGVAGNEGAAAPPVDQPTYENGGAAAPGGFGKSLGVVSDIRNGNTITSLPLLGQKVYAAGEYLAMRARWSPTTVQADDTRDGLLATVLGLTSVPKMTDRAAFGFAFDDSSEPLSFAAVSCGGGNGGAITPYDSALGAGVVHPSDPNATYGWTEFDQSSPKEATSVDDFARGWYEGPGTNFAEWYFPQRLTVDASAAGTLDIADDDWRSKVYGLRAKHGRDIDAPILAVAMKLVGTADRFEALRKLVAPIGSSRVHAGASRTDPAAFQSMAMPELSHLDGLSGADVAGSAASAWYEALVSFAREHTRPGGTVVPAR